MMDLATLQAVNRQAAERAAEEDIRPIELFAYDWEGDNPRPRIPHTGYLAPTDKRIIARYFVDTSGWGQAGEGALTQSEFADAARALHRYAREQANSSDMPGIYWALVEQGQFQGHVEAYVRTDKWFDPHAGSIGRMWTGPDLEPLA